QRAVQARDFAVGEFQIGRITYKATINFAYPILGPREKVLAVVFAALDLGWFNKFFAKTQLPPSATVTLIDRKGIILARIPDPEKWVGKFVVDTPLVRVILSQGEGTVESPGMDGVLRLYGFTPLSNTGDAYVSVGVPKDIAFASANRSLVRNLIALGIVAVLALVAAWFGSDLFVLRQVNSLTKVTRRLSEGDLSARTEIPYGKGELGELARTFNQMAASMEQLVTERKRSEQHLASLHEINVATTSSLDLRTVIKVLMEKIDLVLPYAAVLVWLRNKDSGRLNRAACWNLDEKEWKGRNLPDTPALVKAAIEGKVPVVASNVQTDPRTLDPELYRRNGLVSYLGVPLIVQSKVLGVLVFLTREEHQFTEQEIEFLSILAGQAAMAIHNSQLYEQTKGQAVELLRANEVKAEFLGFVSHELKTPVNTILGYTAMLQDKMVGEINSVQATALEKITLSCTALLNMMNGLLEATRLEAGGVQIEIHEVDLAKFLEEVRSVYDVSLNKELALIWDYPPGLPVAHTDGEKVGHILQNLINNAIKYTDKGSVTVSARHLADLGAVEFEVADTGIGIPEEALPFIFEKFRQVNGSQSRSLGGVGLGLHIVKKFTELLGGEISVKSELGRGSTFTVRIPGVNGSHTVTGKSLAKV
ncbi:MAG: GAF domain-containing protein, partial [Deltaproteobacteria bacterium]|nr:GAF domain-containing protein [Deltaproteobacteria bacterium]